VLYGHDSISEPVHGVVFDLAPNCHHSDSAPFLDFSHVTVLAVQDAASQDLTKLQNTPPL